MNWTTVGVAFISGIAGWLAFFLSPASDRLAFKRKDRDEIISRLERVEREVAHLRRSNRFLTAGVTALQVNFDGIRTVLMRHDSQAVIPTAAEILEQVRANIDALDGDGEKRTDDA